MLRLVLFVFLCTAVAFKEWHYYKTVTDADALKMFQDTEVEENYTGPHLENNEIVTKKFVEDLVNTYNEMGKENTKQKDLCKKWRKGKLHAKYAWMILYQIKKHLEKQPNIVDVTIGDKDKITVVGDIHGQYMDLMNLFKINGYPSESNPYLFNGDYVDRGSYSVGVIFTLFSFQLLYPKHVFLNRGNHETRVMNVNGGFCGDVYAAYGEKMMDKFAEVFNWLPLGHLLNKKILVIHGGLFGEDGVMLKDLQAIKRHAVNVNLYTNKAKGLMWDLLWSDPKASKYIKFRRSHKIKNECASDRLISSRGAGYFFGPNVTRNFVRQNKLDYIIRSHEKEQEGYKVHHDGLLISLFSAPNYCNDEGNKGAYITIHGKNMTPVFNTFEAVYDPLYHYNND